MPPLAVCDDSYTRDVGMKELDRDGCLILEPPNIKTGPTRQGKTPDVYFSKPKFLEGGTNASYSMASTAFISAGDSNILADDRPPFKVNKTFKEPYSQYSYFKPQTVQKKKVERRMYGSPTFVTAPLRKGPGKTTYGLTLGEEFKYISDPVER
jgi:hypothetical protein